MNVVDFAEQILELAAERDHYRREAFHYKEMFQEGMEDTRKSIESSEQLFGNLLVAALDPDSGINRMQRAMGRDPKRGSE
jgi:hypothetical protein